MFQRKFIGCKTIDHNDTRMINNEHMFFITLIKIFICLSDPYQMFGAAHSGRLASSGW